MNNREKNNLSKNVTSKELFQAAVVVAALLILGWYKETGSRVAAFVFVLIPVVGLLYYLRIPTEKRKKAEQEVNSELRKNTIGKLWIGFLWSLGVLSLLLIIYSLIK